jgi:hypothetical protein
VQALPAVGGCRQAVDETIVKGLIPVMSPSGRKIAAYPKTLARLPQLINEQNFARRTVSSSPMGAMRGSRACC